MIDIFRYMYVRMEMYDNVCVCVHGKLSKDNIRH